ncbi:unnamed protein product [Adineta steineri]|uniref:Uncharacterized protein n=1 Tax=Adineta steineri TaxID=433720 RepID=A0A819D4I4_9BILA|nr:unnamed protein product [Adineta steineri]CAF3822323.1 unnamed protein product [Adineta steineri]
MDVRYTILSMLKCHFKESDINVFHVHGIYTVFISGLTDTDYERTPDFDDLETQICSLARIVSPDTNTSYTFALIENDIWTITANWWNTVKWARREVRERAHEEGRQEAEAEMETDDLIADLVDHIVQKITDKSDSNMEEIRKHYKSHVLQALIQLHTKSKYPIFPNKQICDRLLENYKDLSWTYNFNNDVYILLKFLLHKKDRNSKRHASYRIDEYKQLCRQNNIEQSCADFISYRRLKIDPEVLPHIRRLFADKYGIS